MSKEIPYTVPKDILFGWLSTAKDLVKFPGMESKVGKTNFHDLVVMVRQLEHIIEPDAVKEGNLIPWKVD